MSKLKFMQGQEVHEEELKPVLFIGKIIIFPVLLSFLFGFAQKHGMAAGLAFIIFAGLGYIDYKNSKKNDNN